MRTLLRTLLSLALLSGVVWADGGGYEAAPPPSCTPSRVRFVTVYRYYPVYYPVVAPYYGGGFSFGFGPYYRWGWGRPYWYGRGGAWYGRGWYGRGWYGRGWYRR
jgi:hypothetical protein